MIGYACKDRGNSLNHRNVTVTVIIYAVHMAVSQRYKNSRYV